MLKDLVDALKRASQNHSRPSVAPSPAHRSRRSTFPAPKIFGPDRIGIVGFNDDGFVIAKPVTAHSASLQAKTRNLHAKVRGSYTNIADGLRKSLALLEEAPAGALKRVWLLTDGYPNREADKIPSVVKALRKAYVNVNTIGFGDHFDEALLRKIASSTHNGKFFRVKTLRDLSDALLRGERTPSGLSRHHHHMEWTVLVIDLSGSMVNPMATKRKIEVVEEAVLRLLHFKQRCFS